MSVMSGSDSPFGLVASAPIFTISAPLQIPTPQGKKQISSLSFQELGGINSEINVEQYVYVDSTGMVQHTKQMGLTKPPTVTLKRGVDNDLTLWYWHNMALQGATNARTSVYLEVYGGGISSIKAAGVKPLFTFTLVQAWCPKINFSSAKAGESFVTVDVTIACDQIQYGEGDSS
jgi:phage tail-like protein